MPKPRLFYFSEAKGEGARQPFTMKSPVIGSADDITIDGDEVTPA